MLTARSTSYAPGYDASTLSSHSHRRAKTEASHVLPHIQHTSTILDVGCGPGSITCDFATIAQQGHVVGIDSNPIAISAALEETARRNLTNVIFKVADLFAIPFADGVFDIVHCNAVLVHQSDPVQALKEMRRVCKIGGKVAVRETDWDTYVILPITPALEKCGEVMRNMKVTQGMEPNAGRHLARWAIKAGFYVEGMQVDCDVESHFGKEEMSKLAELNAGRVESEAGKRMLMEMGLPQQEIESWSKEWRHWGQAEGAIWAVTHMRLVAIK